MAQKRTDDGDVENGSRCKEFYKTVLDKGRLLLIDCMEPEPIIDIMQEEEFLTFSDCRDIKELPSTTEKNKAIIDKIRSKGEERYKQFKRFLEMSNQMFMLTYLEQLENGVETYDTIKVLRKMTTITNQLKDIRAEMIHLYQAHYISTEISPLLAGNQVHVDALYVPLEMEDVSQKPSSRTPGGNRLSLDGPQKVTTVHDILYDNNQLVDIVFITADVGVGKTTFCKKLIAVWCKAQTTTQDNETRRNSPKIKTNEFPINNTDETSVNNTDETLEDDTDNEFDNIKTMKEFDFLFFVSLNNTSDETEIADMITNQIRIQKLDKHAVQYILHSSKFKCLVVLDGLDEWSEPSSIRYSPSDIKGFPKTDYRSNSNILVTTRPWKMSLLTQMNPYKYKEINLTGIESGNSKTLVESFLKHSQQFNSSHETLDPDQLSKQFFDEIQEKDLTDLSSTPLVLKLLLCLWLECGKLNRSICHVYWAVIDLLLQQSLTRNKHDPTVTEKLPLLACNRKKMPKCFRTSEFDTLQQFSGIFFPVANLCFDALLSGMKKQVKQKFLDRELKQYEIDFELCSKLGVLSQWPVFRKSFIFKERTIGFLHISFQEFFAALYFSQNQEACKQKVKAKCSSFEKVCEYSNFLKFIVGMCPNAMEELLLHIGKIAFALHSHHDVDNMRQILSKIMLDVGIERLNCNEETEGVTLNINYLMIFQNRYSKYLRFVCPYNLQSIILKNVQLTHSLMITLLSSSRHLRTVSIASEVHCQADDECGCLTGLTGKMTYRSLAQVLSVRDQSECFLHLWEYPYLQELHLYNIQLLHTQITDLLTDSKHLMKVEIGKVNAQSDDDCGCLITIQDDDKTSKYSFVKDLKITDGSGLLDHVDKFQNIKEINFVRLRISHTVMSHFLRDSIHLKKARLVDVGCYQDRMCGCHTNLGAASRTDYRGDLVPSQLEIFIAWGGSEIFAHTERYRMLQKLDIFYTTLTHIQITHLLALSSHLCQVQLSHVKCEPDIKCGCLSPIQYERRAYGLTRKKKSFETSVQFCQVSTVFGIFDHMISYPELNDLDIQHTVLSHSEITRLLTASPRLRSVRLYEVKYEPDILCGCFRAARFDLDNDETDVENSSVMEVCTIEGGDWPFEHIYKYPSLKELKICYWETFLPEILDVVSKSPKLLKITLVGTDCKIMDTNHQYQYVHCDNDPRDLPLQLKIIELLLHLSQSCEELLVTLEGIPLLSTDQDAFLGEIKRLKDLCILEFTEMKHPTLETENSFILKVKIKNERDPTWSTWHVLY